MTTENNSKFLSLQKDVCEKPPGTPKEKDKICPTCIPNPSFLERDWTKEERPWLNEKTCEYTVAVYINDFGESWTTDNVSEADYYQEVDLGNGMSTTDPLKVLRKTYIRAGIRQMLRFFGKKETDEIVCATLQVDLVDDESIWSPAVHALGRMATLGISEIEWDITDRRDEWIWEDGWTWQVNTQTDSLGELVEGMVEDTEFFKQQQARCGNIYDVDYEDFFRSIKQVIDLDSEAVVEETEIDPSIMSEHPEIKNLQALELYARANEHYFYGPNSIMLVKITIPAHIFDFVPNAVKQPATGTSKDEIIIKAHDFEMGIKRASSAFQTFSQYQAYFYKFENGSLMHDFPRNPEPSSLESDPQVIEPMTEEPFPEVFPEELDNLTNPSDPNFLAFENLREPFYLKFYINRLVDFEEILKLVLEDAGFHYQTWWSAKNAFEIKIVFDKTDELRPYVIKEIHARQQGCDFKLCQGGAELIDSFGWNEDQTLLGYIANLFEINNELRAPKSPNWLDFTVKYTYPPLLVNYGSSEKFTDKTSLNCIMSAFDKLDDFVLNEAVSFAKVFAYKMNQNTCKILATSNEGKPAQFDIIGRDEGEPTYSEVYESSLDEMGEIIAGEDSTLKSLKDWSADINKEGKWEGLKNILNPCEWNRISTEAVKCMLSGMTLDEGYKSLLKATVGALAEEGLEILMAGLPADLQERVRNQVEQQFKDLPMPWDEKYKSGMYKEGKKNNTKANQSTGVEKKINKQIKGASTIIQKLQLLKSSFKYRYSFDGAAALGDKHFSTGPTTSGKIYRIDSEEGPKDINRWMNYTEMMYNRHNHDTSEAQIVDSGLGQKIPPTLEVHLKEYFPKFDFSDLTLYFGPQVEQHIFAMRSAHGSGYAAAAYYNSVYESIFFGQSIVSERAKLEETFQWEKIKIGLFIHELVHFIQAKEKGLESYVITRNHSTIENPNSEEYKATLEGHDKHSAEQEADLIAREFLLKLEKNNSVWNKMTSWVAYGFERILEDVGLNFDIADEQRWSAEIYENDKKVDYGMFGNTFMIGENNPLNLERNRENLIKEIEDFKKSIPGNADYVTAVEKLKVFQNIDKTDPDCKKLIAGEIFKQETIKGRKSWQDKYGSDLKKLDDLRLIRNQMCVDLKANLTDEIIDPIIKILGGVINKTEPTVDPDDPTNWQGVTGRDRLFEEVERIFLSDEWDRFTPTKYNTGVPWNTESTNQFVPGVNHWEQTIATAIGSEIVFLGNVEDWSGWNKDRAGFPELCHKQGHVSLEPGAGKNWELAFDESGEYRNDPSLGTNERTRLYFRHSYQIIRESKQVIKKQKNKPHLTVEYDSHLEGNKHRLIPNQVVVHNKVTDEYFFFKGTQYHMKNGKRHPGPDPDLVSDERGYKPYYDALASGDSRDAGQIAFSDGGSDVTTDPVPTTPYEVTDEIRALSDKYASEPRKYTRRRKSIKIVQAAILKKLNITDPAKQREKLGIASGAAVPDGHWHMKTQNAWKEVTGQKKGDRYPDTLIEALTLINNSSYVPETAPQPVIEKPKSQPQENKVVPKNNNTPSEQKKNNNTMSEKDKEERKKRFRLVSLKPGDTMQQGTFGKALGGTQKALWDAYKDAILQNATVEELLTALERVPGLKLLGEWIGNLDCPNQHWASPPVSEFLGTLTYDMCGEADTTLALPDFNFPNAKPWSWVLALCDSFVDALNRLVKNLLYALLIKVAQLVEAAICKSLATLSEGVKSVLTGDDRTFQDILDDAICGTQGKDKDKKDKQKNGNTAIGLSMPKSPTMAAAGAIPYQTEKFSADPNFQKIGDAISKMATERELVSAISCSPDNRDMRFMNNLSKTLPAIVPELAEGFNTPEKCSKFFTNISNLIDKNTRKSLCNSVKEGMFTNFPIDSSICLTKPQRKQWDKDRCDMFQRAGLSPQVACDFVQAQNDKARSDLQDIATLMAQNPAEQLSKAIQEALDQSQDPDCKARNRAIADVNPPQLEEKVLEASKGLFRRLENAFLDDTVEDNTMLFVPDPFDTPGVLNWLLSDVNGNIMSLHNVINNSWFYKYTVWLGNTPAWPDTVGLYMKNELDRTVKGAIAGGTNQNTDGPIFQKPKTILAVGTALERNPNEEYPSVSCLIDFDTKDTTNLAGGVIDQSISNVDIGYYDQISSWQLSDDNDPLDDALDESTWKTMNFDYAINLNKSSARNKNLVHVKNELQPDVVEIVNEIDINLSELDGVGVQSHNLRTYRSVMFKKHLQRIMDQHGFVMQSLNNEAASKMYEGANNIILKHFMPLLLERDQGRLAQGFIFGNKTVEILPNDIENILNPNTMQPLSDEDIENGVLGVSQNPRITFLDPKQYGGNYEEPYYHISAPEREGWMELAKIFVPGFDGCEEMRSNFLQFKNIQQRIEKTRTSITPHPALSKAPDCVREIPFDAIRSPSTLAILEGTVMATIRVYLAEYFITTMPIISNVRITDKCYDDYLVTSIVEKIKNGLKSQHSWTATTYEGENYWLLFLEQATQAAKRRLDAGEIENNPALELADNAILEIQNAHNTPMWEDFFMINDDRGFFDAWAELNVLIDDLRELPNDDAVYNDYILEYGLSASAYTILSTVLVAFGGWTGLFITWPLIGGLAMGLSLNQAKFASKILSIRLAEKHAMVFFKELVRQELDFYKEIIDDRMPLRPYIFDVNKYFIGGSKIFLGDDKINAGIYDYEVPVGNNPETHPYGTVVNCSPDGHRHPLEGMSFDASSWPPQISDIKNYGGFYIEKYLRIEDRVELVEIEDMSGNETTAPILPDPLNPIPEWIKNRDEIKLKNVVNIEEFKEFLTSNQSEISEEINISDWFGNASLDTTSENGYKGSTGIKFGVRICMVSNVSHQSDAVFEETNKQVAEKEKTFILNRISSVPNTGFVFPVASYEQDIQDNKLLSYIDSDVNFNQDLKCYIDKLVETPEFKLFFDHILNVKKSTSLLLAYSNKNFISSIGYGENERTNADGDVEDFRPPWLPPGDFLFNDSKAEARSLFVSNYKRNDFDPPDEEMNMYDSLKDRTDALLSNLWSNIGSMSEIPWWLRNRMRKDKSTDKDGNPCKNEYASLFKMTFGDDS